MSEIPFFKGRKSLVFLAGREFLVLSRYMLRILICCFFLALASGRRRSEIHAFSVSDSCLRFNRNESSVTLFHWGSNLFCLGLSRLKLLTSKEMYSFCPKSDPPSKDIVLPIADLYPLIVEGTNQEKWDSCFFCFWLLSTFQQKQIFCYSVNRSLFPWKESDSR
jgi:hypothetical protein